MGYLPDGVPLPEPGPDDGLYWESCRKRELRIQRCAALHRGMLVEVVFEDVTPEISIPKFRPRETPR